MAPEAQRPDKDGDLRRYIEPAYPIAGINACRRIRSIN